MRHVAGLLAPRGDVTALSVRPTAATSPSTRGKAEVGVIGLGTMGSNLALNLLDKGFAVAVWNLEADVADKFAQSHGSTYGPSRLFVGKTLEEFAALLSPPRKALILVTAGQATDSVIEGLADVFEQDDIIVDTGNAHFRAQSERAAKLEARGLRFLGMGVSGGAEGARKGPAFFPGGTLSVWDEIKPIVEAIAAKASDGRPCATMCGSGGAGSCVKMYHNAGEYAVLQIWGEAFTALRGLGFDGKEIRSTLSSWKARGPLDSYMLDITIEVAAHRDDAGDLVDRTADIIGSKGTGLWSVTEAFDAGEPVPSLAAAVLARQMSMRRPERRAIAQRIASKVQGSASVMADDVAKAVEDLYWATRLAILASYAQMFQAIRAVDKLVDPHTGTTMGITSNLPRIISTFRAGCILQGALLQPMTEAFEKEPELTNLLCAFPEVLEQGMPGLRRTCARLSFAGEAPIVMQASLGYILSMTQQALQSAQVVALQRDVFGRHGFQRLGPNGEVSEKLYHAEWPEMIP